MSGALSIHNFSDLLQAAEQLGPMRIAIAAAHDPEVLVAAHEAQQRRIATSTLIGNVALMQEYAHRDGISLDGMVLEQEPDERKAAQRAVELARSGQADAVVKGHLKTDQLLGAALSRDAGIRFRRLLTHVGLFEIPGMDRMLYISDGGVVLYPTIMQKLEIILNVVDVARFLGVAQPKVAILAASEWVHPGVPASIDAMALARMAAQGWVEGADVDGPMALDVAISPQAAAAKGIGGAVAGQANILIVPSVEAGNAMSKSIQYFGKGRMAGLVVGARVPIIINSRSDDHETRLRSIAMALALSAAGKASRNRLGVRFEEAAKMHTDKRAVR